MDLSKLRAWWAHRQGLDGSLAGAAPAEVLARSGWARSVAGVGPYLTLFSRAAIGRKAADAAVAALEIHELPSARGCTYVVPADDFALALRCVAGFGRHADMRTAEKLGVTDKEIDSLCDAVLAALANAPLDPEAIRDAVGAATRSLGEAGKKKGLTTTLPLALGKLQEEGEIRRVPVNGRLDQQRYQYTLWRPNPLAKFRLSQDEVHAELAKRYFRWIGPATLAEFQWFSGLGVKAAKAASAGLGLLAIPGDENRLLFPEGLDAFQGFEPPRSPRPVLVSSLDALVLLRRDLASLVAEEDRKTKVLADEGVASLGGLSDLPSHAIVERGRVIGLWEYDPDSATIAWMTFGKPTKPAAAAIAEAVAKVEVFVRDDLGDARSFSLDSPKSRAPRIAAIRKAAKAR
jgi:hypothetical protein